MKGDTQGFIFFSDIFESSKDVSDPTMARMAKRFHNAICAALSSTVRIDGNLVQYNEAGDQVMVLLARETCETEEQFSRAAIAFVTEAARQLRKQGVRARIGLHYGRFRPIVLEELGKTPYIGLDLVKGQRVMSFGEKDHVLISKHALGVVCTYRKLRTIQARLGCRIVELPEPYWAKHNLSMDIANVWSLSLTRPFGSLTPPVNIRKVVRREQVKRLGAIMREEALTKFVSVTHFRPKVWMNDVNLVLVISYQALAVREAATEGLSKEFVRVVIWPIEDLIGPDGKAVLCAMISSGVEVYALPQEDYDAKVRLSHAVLRGSIGLRRNVEFYLAQKGDPARIEGQYGGRAEKGQEDELCDILEGNHQTWLGYSEALRCWSPRIASVEQALELNESFFRKAKR